MEQGHGRDPRPTSRSVKAAAVAVAVALSAVAGLWVTFEDRERPAAQPPDGLRLSGPLPAGARAAVDAFLDNPVAILEPAARDVAGFRDLRLGWVLAEFARFHQDEPTGRAALESLARLTKVEPAGEKPWARYTQLLLDWDVPPPPGYLRFKRKVYLLFDPSWAAFFDPRAKLDWRLVSWGGVTRDAIRSLDAPDPVPPDDIGGTSDSLGVVGVVISGEPRAYTLDALATHELVNDQLGGREIAVTYCTLCQSAIVYLRDTATPPVDLGTSGWLYQSNKLMFDRRTESLFHQLTGRAVAGPLGREGLILEPAPASVTTWREWRLSHPKTSLVAGIRYRDYPSAPGPSEVERFPVERADSRLPGRTVVVGVRAPDGEHVAFVESRVHRALAGGRPVRSAGVELTLSDGAITALSTTTGRRLFSHSSFWFAWSHFHPDTAVWEGG